MANDMNQAWSALGLQPQAFPAFDAASATYFQDGNNEKSGAAGSELKIGFSLDNFPRMILGVRVKNVWQMPEDPTEAEIRLCEYVSRVVDSQQTISVDLTTSNITLRNPVLQSALMGDGSVWHSFPAGFDAAGGNDFNLSIRRVTSYPLLRDVRIVPTVYVSLVSIAMRADRMAAGLVRVGV